MAGQPLALVAGQIRAARVPFNDTPDVGKHRPVIVIGWSPMTARDDAVVLVVPVTSFEGTPKPKLGDVELDYQACGLSKPSWARARRLWGANPRAFTGKVYGNISDNELKLIYLEIEGLL